MTLPLLLHHRVRVAPSEAVAAEAAEEIGTETGEAEPQEADSSNRREIARFLREARAK